MFIPSVYGTWVDDGTCQAGTDCTITRILINETNGTIINNANCTINIYDTINTSRLIIDNAQMVNASNGMYNYTFNLGTAGKYNAMMLCSYLNATNVLGGTGASTDYGDVSFSVSAGYINYLYGFLFFFIFLLTILGFIEKEQVFLFFAGVISIVFALMIYREGILIFSDTFIVNSISVIFLAYGFILILDSGIKMIQGSDI